MNIVSKNIRVRYPDHFTIGENSIVDDFSYFATRIVVGDYTHIAARCTIAGGKARLFRIGSFGSVSSGASVWCSSDDFINDIVTIFPEWMEQAGAIKEHFMTGDVLVDDYCAIGANAVVMPKNHIPEGTVVGALSFVPPEFAFEPWSVYAGIPIRRVKSRNRESVLRQVAAAKERIRRHTLGVQQVPEE